MTHQNQGRKQTPEHIAKRVASNKNNPNWILHSKNLAKQNSLRMTGKIISEEHKQKIGNALRDKYSGNRSWMWKGGISPINERIRKSSEYKLWRKAVFERDNWTCIWGGKEHGYKLHADHIKPFALFPELRFAIDNGRTLCENCHRKTETWGVRKEVSL